jgi:hypothetical protein
VKHTFIIFASLALVGCGKKETKQTIYTPPVAITSGAPTGEFSPQKVADLEQLKASSDDPIERAIAEMLILSNHATVGGTLKPEEIRPRIEALIREHPGTWISANARIGLMETYNPAEQFKQRIDTLNDLLNDPGLLKMGDTSDPYLKPFLVGEEAPHITESPKDYVLFLLTYNYTVAYDVGNAEKSFAQIQSEYWKGRISRRIDELRQTPVDIVSKRKEAFVKNQK